MNAKRGNQFLQADIPLLIAFKRAAHRGAAFHAQVHGRASRIRKNKEDRKQRKPLDSEPGSKAQHGVKPSSTLAGFSAQRWSRKGPDAPYSPHRRPHAAGCPSDQSQTARASAKSRNRLR